MKNKLAISIFVFSLILSLTLISYGYYIKNLNKNSNNYNDVYVNAVYKEVKEETENNFMEATNYSDISNYISTDKKMIVIGRTGCIHCEKYKPTVKSASDEYKFSVMYIDIKTLIEDDLNSLLDSDILIPSKCTSTGMDSKLRDGFGTPLTLILENGKTYDCIRGNVDKNTLINSLREAKYILR